MQGSVFIMGIYFRQECHGVWCPLVSILKAQCDNQLPKSDAWGSNLTCVMQLWDFSALQPMTKQEYVCRYC